MTENDYPPETKPAQIQEFFSPDRQKKLIVAKGPPLKGMLPQVSLSLCQRVGKKEPARYLPEFNLLLQPLSQHRPKILALGVLARREPGERITYSCKYDFEAEALWQDSHKFAFVPSDHPLPLIKDLPKKISISETTYPFLESIKRIMANQAQEEDFRPPQIKGR